MISDTAKTHFQDGLHCQGPGRLQGPTGGRRREAGGGGLLRDLVRALQGEVSLSLSVSSIIIIIKMIAPHLEEMSKADDSVVFLKVIINLGRNNIFPYLKR